MAKRNRRKRKSRTELYRVRATRLKTTHWFVIRVPNIVRGGNAFGLGEYTLMISAGPGRA